MRCPTLAFLLLVVAAAPLSAQGSTATAVQSVSAVRLPIASVTWSGPTPACRLDRCGPNVKQFCLLRSCAADSARTVTSNGSAAVTGIVWPVRLLEATRADSARRPAPAPRPRR